MTIVLLGVVAIGAIAGAAVLALGFGRVPTPTVAGPAPRFAEETATAGIDRTYGGGFQAAFGGGLATFDCNDDSRPELYLAGGDGPAALFVNRSPAGGSLRFEARSGRGSMSRPTGTSPSSAVPQPPSGGYHPLGREGGT